MTLVFPIVGLRHFIPEDNIESFVACLPEGASVKLVYDNANTYDRYAIQAWMELRVNEVIKWMQVGHVSSDFAPMICANYTTDDSLFAQVVHPETSLQDESFFEVEIDLQTLDLPSLPHRINLDPIANIPLPVVPPDKKIVWKEIMEYSREELNADELIELSQRSISLFGHGLSGDERMAYTLLSTMLAFMHGQWTDRSEQIWQQRMALDGARRMTFNTPERCAQVMDEEMQAFKQSASSFFDQYQAIIAAGLTSREQEIQAHTQWLKALPDNLYAWVKNKPVFASKLYYERFVMEDLYAIYLHLLCVEWLIDKGKKKKLTPDVKQRIEAFPYWCRYVKHCEKVQAVEKMQDALISSTYPISALAIEIKRLHNKQILDMHTNGSFQDFVKALNALLDAKIKSNSLRKHFSM